MAEEQVIEKPESHDVIAPGYTFATVTDQISAVVMTRHTPLFWFASFVVAFMLLQGLLASAVLLFAKGTGIWGIRTPVMWGFAITNFVWWIGIGHAGTVLFT